LVFRGFVGVAVACRGVSVVSVAPLAGPALASGVATEICVVCTPASLWALTLMMLRPSSSVALVSDMLGGLVEPTLRILVAAEPLICWISREIFSVFIASRMFAVAVGSRARTVKVQSSWFCSKRRRRLRQSRGQPALVPVRFHFGFKRI
jgi:hypothetical protein